MRQGAKRTVQPPAKKPVAPPPPVRELPSGPLRLGIIPGATPGKWIDTWHDRMPSVTLELIPLSVAAQREALFAASAEDRVDVALIRLPIDSTGLNVIRLYEEVAVVICAADSHLTAADELTIADLEGEILITPADDVLAVTVPGSVTPTFDPPETTEDAVATIAAGVGITIVPLSLARLHHRKDVEHRVLADGPPSQVAIAWPIDAESELAEAFVGIVRGRTSNSSR